MVVADTARGVEVIYCETLRDSACINYSSESIHPSILRASRVSLPDSMDHKWNLIQLTYCRETTNQPLKMLCCVVFLQTFPWKVDRPVAVSFHP